LHCFFIEGKIILAKNIFILGAGASKDAGAPLMNDFLDRAEKILPGNDIDFINTFEAISDLQAVYSKSYLDLDNIETLFGVLEMAVLLNKLSNYDEEKIKKVRASLINLIVKTLEESILFPLNTTDILPPYYYEKFASLLDKLQDCSVITFNYDIAIDYAIYRAFDSIDYCLPSGNRDGFKLMKLHGSINWGRCSTCNTIIPFTFNDYFRLTNQTFIDSRTKPRNRHFKMSEKLSLLSHPVCNQSAVSPTPIIVPPTWNKNEYNGELSNVWREASKELSDAVNIFIIGYSLPETDSFFRYLYALGTMGTTRIKRIWAFNPDNEGEVKRRYKALIGKGVENRFEYFPQKFGEAIEFINDELIIKGD
jgi:NAD-dependent SIR2 family protein deacetylase